MNSFEILEFVFGDEPDEFTLYDASGTETPVTIEGLRAGMPDAVTADLSVNSTNMVYGFEVADERWASLSLTDGTSTVLVCVLDTPVDANRVPEAVANFEIPLGPNWTGTVLSDALFDTEAVLAWLDTPQPDEEADHAEAALENEDVGGGDDLVSAAPDRGDEEVADGGAESVDPAQAAAHDAGSAGASRADPATAVEPAGGDDPAVGADGGEAVEPEFFNDAELLGADCPEFEAILEQPVTLMIGEMWGAKDRRNTQDGDWKQVTMPWVQWIDGSAGNKNTAAWGFSRHPEGKEKAGACVVFGSSIGQARKAKAMSEMFAMGIDIDSGITLDEILPRLEALGLFCLVYTSHSHGKRGLQLKHDVVIQKLKIKPSELNKAQVQKYLREIDKNRYDESFISKIEIKEMKKQVKEGVVIELSTPPLDKFRLIFPLAQPVKIIDLAETQGAALEVWEDKITGLATELLGVHFDTSCTDPSRLFYTARHPKDAEDWFCGVVRGKPLVFEDVPVVRKSSYTNARRALNAFEMAGGVQDDGDKPPMAFAPSGASLNDWHRVAKDRFNMADLLEDQCSDRVRVAGGEAQGHIHIECPFEHEHTSEGGTATMVVNALDSQSGYWSWFCHHDACQGRHKLSFLEEALRQNWFSEDLMFGDSLYLMPGEDPEEDENDVAEEEEEAAQDEEPKTLTEIAATMTDATEADILKFLKKCRRAEVDSVEKATIINALAKATPLGKTDIKKLWQRLDDDARKREKERAQKDEGVEKEEGTALVNEWDFHDMVHFSHRKIHDRNQEQPSVFHYMESLYVIREDSEGHARMKGLDRDGFAYHLNTVARFGKVTSVDGDQEVRGVSAPDDVVRHLFAADYGTYPELRGLVSTPIFTKTGDLLTTPGYDRDSRLFYKPDMTLSVPVVSDDPTEEEVERAKQLLIEEILADFPLGGLTRPEIVEQALHGEGVPAVANMIALMLLPFMRELVDGPTPGHLLVKPSPGTGASLLTDVFSIIATGKATPALAMPGSKDEMSKTLTSILSNGQNIVFFDNINHSVDSGELASAMTAPTYQARILGKSQTVEVAVRCAWVFTGNNVTLSSELVRRLIMVDLDAQVANPELRTDFRHADIRGWAVENRGNLVWACLTLIQNWVADGMPGQNSAILASYENWSRTLGGVLAAAGIGGFMKNRDMLKEKASDDEGDSIQYMVEAWWSEFGSKYVFLRGNGTKDNVGLIEIALEHDLALSIRKERSADGEMSYNKTSFGKWLSTYSGRVFQLEDGTEVRLEKDGKRSSKGARWRLAILNRDLKGNVAV